MPEPAPRFAIAADVVFDGATAYRDHAVVVADTDIVGLTRRRELPTGWPVHRLPEGVWLTPGFIDVQVNGGGDVLFNDAPAAEAAQMMAAAHRRFGTTGLLPTLISDTTAKMRAASDAVRAAMQQYPSILGVHFEGPFLSPERAGAHDAAMFRAPTDDDLALVNDRRGVVRLVTLAPERVPPGFIAALTSTGVRVALGHSMATYDETRQAMAEGLTGFTHLFNAMPPLAAREPGPIGAGLEAPGAFYSLIADGVHVAPAMLRLALRGAGQAMLVTDAMPPVGGTAREFMLCGKKVVARDGVCAAADGMLAGSLLDMASAVRNCVGLLGMKLPDALRLATAAPATFLGLADRLGYLGPGRRADLVALDPDDVRVLGTWVAGRPDEAASVF
jgi:N-acetylglucosamine-6-phosphate deacetylase